MNDMNGVRFSLHCKIAIPVMDSDFAPAIRIGTVTKIENHKVFIDGSEISLLYPEKSLIIEHCPLYKMVLDYKSDSRTV
jgi:hypothetical protein